MSVAGGFLTTTVPLWVELVYGYDVVLAAPQLLTEVEDAEDLGVNVVSLWDYQRNAVAGGSNYAGEDAGGW